MKFPLFVSGLLILLAGCQGSGLSLKDDIVFQQTIPVCATDEECEKVWAAARQWVLKATPQGLEVDSAERLQTSPADDESYLWETDITVSKVPVAGDKYQIVMEAWCNTTINSCEAERRLMRRFNKDMAAYVSPRQSQAILSVFNEGDDMDTLFGSYAASLTAGDLRRHADMYYLPSTIVSGDNIRQLGNSDDVVAFLEETRARLAGDNITRVEAQQRQLLSSSKNTAIVQLQWAFYGADDEPQYTRKATYTLIKIGKGWKIMSASLGD